MAGSGVWQDCQSLPTRTLHQQWNLTLGKGSELSWISSLSTTVMKGKKQSILDNEVTGKTNSSSF